MAVLACLGHVLASQTSEQLLRKPVFGGACLLLAEGCRNQSVVCLVPRKHLQRVQAQIWWGRWASRHLRGIHLGSLDGGCTISVILLEEWKIPSIPYTPGPRPWVILEPSIPRCAGFRRQDERWSGKLSSGLQENHCTLAGLGALIRFV